MRVTNQAMANSYLNNVQKNLQSVNKLYTEASTGKQINKVSDNPYEAIKIINMQNEMSDVERYNYNCDEISGWLDMTDSALDQIASLTSDVKVLLTSISGTVGEDEIKAIRSEVNEKIKQIGESMNTTYGGKYIFGGSITDEPPVTVITNDDGTVELKINNEGNANLDSKLTSTASKGLNVQYNLTINNITKTNGQETNSTNGLDILNKLSQALNADNPDIDEISKFSSDLDEYMNDVLSNRTVVGAKMNVVENLKLNNDDNLLQMTASLSNIQDTDIAETYLELTSAQLVYNSSLQISSKIFQNSILDYL